MIGDGKNGIFSLAASAIATIQPPSGEEWVVRDIQPAGASTLTVSVYDGTNAAVVRTSDSCMWNRKMSLFITNGAYLRLQNISGASAKYTYSAMVTNVSGSAAGRADAKITVTPVAFGATLTVQPPSGQSWMLLDVGSSRLTTDTGANSVAPDMLLNLFDGTNTIAVAAGGGIAVGNYGYQWNPILTNAVYVTINNNNSASSLANIAYVAVRMS